MYIYSKGMGDQLHENENLFSQKVYHNSIDYYKNISKYISLH